MEELHFDDFYSLVAICNFREETKQRHVELHFPHEISTWSLFLETIRHLIEATIAD